MGKDAPALCAGLGSTNRMRNLRIEYPDFAAVGIAEQPADLFAEVRPAVHHGQQDAVDLQPGIDLSAYPGYRLKELLQTLCREILRLNRNQYAVRSGQRIDREHAKRRHAVNKNIVVVAPDAVQILPQHRFPAHGVHQSHLHAGKLDVCRHEGYALVMAQDSPVVIERPVHEDAAHHVRERGLQRIGLMNPKADG